MMLRNNHRRKHVNMVSHGYLYKQGSILFFNRDSAATGMVGGRSPRFGMEGYNNKEYNN